MAIKEPWRMAFSLLYDFMGDDLLAQDFSFLKEKTAAEISYLQTFLKKNIQAPLTSSCGRLFDAVSSCLGITHKSSFEAEAAISLEKKASLSDDQQSYSFDIKEKDGIYIVGYRSFLSAMYQDRQKKLPIEVLARRFHTSLARLIVDMAKLLRRDTGVQTVVLSGGVFQNRLLAADAKAFLLQEGFKILEDENAPVNDLGICTGQTYAALQEKIRQD